MKRFKRSWELSKVSFWVMRKDKEMLLFPLFAGILSVLFSAVIIISTDVVQYLRLYRETEQGLGHPVVLAVVFLLYFGLTFIVSFFNICTVFTSKTRFEGGNASFMDSIKFSAGKFTRIIQWSFLQATLGVLLFILRLAIRRLPLVAELIPHALQMAWSTVTIFVLPTFVYEDVGPFRAIRQSMSILRKTWGETLIQTIGLGFILCVGLFVVWVIHGLLIFVALSTPGIRFELVSFISLYVSTLIVFLLFSAANTVFKTALYIYATTGTEPSVYSETALSATTFQEVFSKDDALASN